MVVCWRLLELYADEGGVQVLDVDDTKVGRTTEDDRCIYMYILEPVPGLWTTSALHSIAITTRRLLAQLQARAYAESSRWLEIILDVGV